MVTIQVKNIDGATILPVAGSTLAAGYDIVAIEDPKIVGEIGNVREIDGKEVTFYRRIDYLEYKTGLFISPQSSAGVNSPHTLIHPRSSIRKYDLVLANSIGLIDNDYRGEILVCYKYIWQPDTLAMETVKVPISDGGEETGWEVTGRLLGAINPSRIYKKGDKIAQLVAEPTTPVQFKLVSELDETTRGEGGFGSTEERTKVPAPNPPQKTNINIPASSPIIEKYQQSGGVPTRKKYIDQVKERDRN